MNTPTKTETITLETPIERGETKIEDVTVRKPNAGELRGLNIQGIQQGDVNTILTLLPRITNPPLITQECEALDAVDLLAFTGAVSGFFYSKEMKGLIAKVTGEALDS